MPYKLISQQLMFIVVLIAAFALSSCGGGTSGPGSSGGSPGTPSSAAASPKSGFEADLEYVRKGQYTYVWVFSRKDNKTIDKDDAAYLRTNAPQVVDWVTTEEGRKVIAGTNFDLAKGNLELLKKRFVVEDYTGK